MGLENYWRPTVNRIYTVAYSIDEARVSFLQRIIFSNLIFLANVNVLRYVCYMLSAVRLSSVCL